jgi:autotransporter-associated beta strand protein
MGLRIGRRIHLSRLQLERLEERIALSTHTWTGAVSSLWSVAGNWIGGTPAGDTAADLQFPASGVSRFTSTDDLPGQTPISSIQFAGSGFTVNAAAGNSIGLTFDITNMNATGTNTVSSPVALMQSFASLSTSGSSTLVLGGAISGSTGLFVQGTGEVVLSGDNAQLAGGISLTGGTLTVGSNSAIGTGLLVLGGGLLRSNGPLTFPNNYQVGLGGQPGAVTIGGNNNLTLTGQGNLLFNDLTINSGAAISLMGNIIGSNGLFMLGNGTLILGGMNSYSGNTTISAGTVLINGTNTASQALLSAGTLGGTGFVSGISATGGTIGPGTSATIGTLTTDSLAMNASTTLAIKLRTNATGNVADQLVARGIGNLGGSTLQLNPQPGFLSPVGDTFNLVANGGTGTIAGSFANSSPLTIAGNGRFQLSYSSVAATLTHINTPPSLSGIMVTSPVYETRPATLTGTITDPDPLDAFMLTITWGDGSPVQALNLAAGSTAFSVPHTYTRESAPTYAIALTVSDGHPGATASGGATVTVLDRLQSPAALAVALAEGQLFSGPVATFQDAVDGASTDFSATINWGDGAPTTTGQIVKTGTGRFQVNGAHTYAEEGSYPITVVIRDSDGTTVSPTSTATLMDPALVPVVVFKACSGESRPLINVTLASFLDPGGREAASNYSTQIDWGDGTSATAGVVDFTTIVTRFPPFFPNTSQVPLINVSGTHTYFSEGAYSATVTITHDTAPPTVVHATIVIGGFISSLYKEILNRLPDVPGLSFWLQQLHAGVPRDQIARGFWESAEHRGLEVDQYYATLLHRPADAAGRAAWVNALLAGTSEGDVVIAFLTSPEYTARHADNAAFVNGLFSDLLRRAGDPAGLAFWQDQLRTGARSRAGVALGFLSSTEAYLQAIDDYYASFLGRAPDPLGRSSFLAILQSSFATPASVAAVFLGSDEFLSRSLVLACQ